MAYSGGQDIIASRVVSNYAAKSSPRLAASTKPAPAGPPRAHPSRSPSSAGYLADLHQQRAKPRWNQVVPLSCPLPWQHVHCRYVGLWSGYELVCGHG